MSKTIACLLLASPAAFANQVVVTPQCQREVRLNQFQCSVAIDRDVSDDVDVHNSLAVRFDVASAVPAGATIQSVQLTMNVVYFTSPGPFAMHEILTPACTASWSGPNNGLGAPAGPPLAIGTSAPHQTFSAPAITALVQRWSDFPAQNLGVLFAAYDPFDSAICELCVGGFQLTIDYTPPCPPPVRYCVAAPNSQGPNGATFSITGSTSVTQNDMTIVATGVRPGAPGFFYFGGTQQQLPLGNGFTCVGNPIFRLAAPNLFADASGTLRRPVNFTFGNALHLTPGSTWFFQCMYRDLAGGGAGYNLTDGLAITFCP